MSDEAAGRLILRGTAATVAGFAIRFGARFLFLLVAARLYGATLLGAYAIALSLVEVAVIAAGLGSKWLLFQWLDRAAEQSRAPAHVVADAALLVAGSALAIAALAAIVVLAVPPGLVAPATAAAIWWLAPAIVLQALIELSLAATRWTHAMRWEVIGKSIVQPYVSTAVAIGCAWGGARTVGLPLSYLAASAVTLSLALLGLRGAFGAGALSGYRIDRARIAAMLRATGANTGADLLDAASTRLDVALVGLLLGEAAAGLYAVAKQIAVVLRQVRQSFDGLLIPIVSRTFAAAGAAATARALASAIRLVLVSQLPVLVALVAGGPMLMRLFGTGFVAAYPALLALAAAETIQGSFGLGDLFFVYRGPRIGLALTLAGIAAGIVAALVLTRALGVAGAALSVLIAYAVRAVLRRETLRRRFGITTPLATSLPALGAAMLGAGAALAVGRLVGASPLAVPLRLGAGLGTYALATLVWVRGTGIGLVPRGFVSDPLPTTS